MRIPIESLRTTDTANTIVYKNVYVIAVWRNDKIAWYDQYTIKGGLYLGRTTTLKYLEEASKCNT